ncbi:unnamed protein product [Colias eurytheme]|nr:unnamed protein product [Colias eurytheme]
MREMANKITWRCTKHTSKKCNVLAVTVDDKVNNKFKPLIGVVYIRTKGTTQHIELDSYVYSLHTTTGLKGRWRCLKQRKGCRAVLMTYDFYFGPGENGGTVFYYQGFRFHRNYVNGDKVSWKCNKWRYLKPVFAQSQRGNKVIMIGKYRFNRVTKHGMKSRWVCVKAKAGCRASLHTIDNAITRISRFTSSPPGMAEEFSVSANNGTACTMNGWTIKQNHGSVPRRTMDAEPALSRKAT